MTLTTQNCPFCDSGDIALSTYWDDFKYGSGSISVHGLNSYFCSTCNTRSITPDQARKNQKIIADAKRHQCGLLSSNEIYKIRRQFNLTQQDAAKIFGGGPTAFSKYERGDVVQSVPMDRLIRGAANFPNLFFFLCDLAGAESSKTRIADVRFQVISTEAVVSDTSGRWIVPIFQGVEPVITRVWLHEPVNEDASNEYEYDAA